MLFVTRNGVAFSDALNTVCAKFETTDPLCIDSNVKLLVNAEHYQQYIDVEFDFGSTYSGSAKFRLTGQPAETINIVNGKLSLTELLPRLYNTAVRPSSASTVYGPNVGPFVYSTWEILLSTAPALNCEQLVHYHDTISNHVGLRCCHIGIPNEPSECESCAARYIIRLLLKKIK